MKFVRLFLLASYLLLISCNGAIVYEEIDLQSETEAWIVKEERYHSFQMTDENGIKSSWNLTEEDNYYSESRGSFLFIPTNKSNREIYFQKFRNTILGDFIINADAGFSDVNPWISFNTPELSFEFDAVTYKPNRLYLSPNNGNSFSWSEYEDMELPLEFRVMTNFEVNGKTYPEEVAIFELTDQVGILEPKSIVKFAFSKEVGLIYIELKNELKFNRL